MYAICISLVLLRDSSKALFYVLLGFIPASILHAAIGLIGVSIAFYPATKEREGRGERGEGRGEREREREREREGGRKEGREGGREILNSTQTFFLTRHAIFPPYCVTSQKNFCLGG